MCNLVIAAANGVGAAAVEYMPSSPSSYRFRFLMARKYQPCSRTGQRDLRAVGGLVRSDPPSIQDTVGAHCGQMDYIPPIFNGVLFVAVMFLVVVFVVVMFLAFLFVGLFFVVVMFLARSAN